MKSFRSPRVGRAGLTLIELVVVLLIVAVLAGLVIPQVAQLTRTANMTGSASCQADLANSVQLFFATNARYPQGFDSLLDTAGDLYIPDGSSTTQTRGLPASTISFPDAAGTGTVSATLHSQLFASTLENATGANYLRSFSRSGFDWVWDHDITAGINANNSGSVQRLVPGTGPFAIVEVRTTGTAAETGLFRAISPAGLQAGERIIAIGIGPRITAIPATMINSPIFPGSGEGKYYGRYIAYFKVYASGERATLVAVTDCYGRWPDYTQQQIDESLPNNRRQS